MPSEPEGDEMNPTTTTDPTPKGPPTPTNVPEFFQPPRYRDRGATFVRNPGFDPLFDGVITGGPNGGRGPSKP